MKARQSMNNQALIQEVISHISRRFAPNVPNIKKASYPGAATPTALTLIQYPGD